MKPASPSPATLVPIDGRADFVAALRAATARAARLRSRALCFVDPDFGSWPLEDAEVLAALAAWGRLPKRRLQLVAGSFDALPLRYPRFTAWRRQWAHVVEAHVTEIEASQIPSLLLSDTEGLILLDRHHWRGHWLGDDSEIGAWREVVDALLQRSEPGFAANTLGL